MLGESCRSWFHVVPPRLDARASLGQGNTGPERICHLLSRKGGLWRAATSQVFGGSPPVSEAAQARVTGRSGIRDTNASAFDGDPPGGHGAHDGRQQAVLLGEDALAQAVLVVPGQDRHRSLRDDGTGVRARVDEMHGAAGKLYAVVERLLLRVRT